MSWRNSSSAEEQEHHFRILNIEWRLILEYAPNFGGLWEDSIKSAKTHLRCFMRPVKFTYEEFSTIFAQFEACLNSSGPYLLT